MKVLLVLCGCLSLATAIATKRWVSLTYKFGLGPLAREMESAFFPSGNTTEAANTNDWSPIENDNQFGLTSLAYLGTDWRVINLYCKETNALVGFQLSISKAEFDKNGPPKTNPLDSRIGIYEVKVIKGITTYSTTFYFVDPATLETSCATKWTGLYVKNATSGTSFTKIQDDIDSLLEENIYTQQSCIPFMGTHFYYKMDRYTDCDVSTPLFLLYNKGELIGIGWQQFLPPTYDVRNWWEHVSRLLDAPIVPNCPKCRGEYIDKYKMTSVHVYFTEKPWKMLTC